MASIASACGGRESISLEQKTCARFTINADRIRFKQIVYNLLSNAVKFTRDRGKVSN